LWVEARDHDARRGARVRVSGLLDEILSTRVVDVEYQVSTGVDVR
jgi:hypothetical protein